jgi:hypothetical protein
MRIFLPSAFVITASFCFALTTQAAPGILSKRQLSLPQIPKSVLSRLSSMKWTFTYTDTASKNSGWLTKTSNFVKVSETTLQNEKVCGGTDYREWIAKLDFRSALKKHESVYSNNSSYVAYETGFILQAVRNGETKWLALQLNGVRNIELVGCSGQDIVVMKEAVGSGYLQIPFEKINDPSWWKRPNTYPRSIFASEVIVDGVPQRFGEIGKSVFNGKTTIYGSSSIAVAQGSNFKIENPPWYRDINSVNFTGDGNLRANFYRYHDGYGVEEELCTRDVDTTTNTTITKVTMTNYRIHDGEAAYSIVPSLPTPTNHYLYSNEAGVVITGFDPHLLVLIHGGKNLNAQNTVWGTVVSETADTAVVRYTFTPPGGRLQYWEATIQK